MLRTLKAQLNERDKVMDQFEEKVLNMKNSFHAKESKLKHENEEIKEKQRYIYFS